MADSRWQRFLSWARGDDLAELTRTESRRELPSREGGSAGTNPAANLPRRANQPAASRPPKLPKLPKLEEDEWLDQLAVAVAAGKRRVEIGDDEFWDHVNALSVAGHERLAVEWIEKFIVAPNTPADAVVGLRARLVELLADRGQWADALGHLDVLRSISAHALRANYLLGEHHRRSGDEVLALRYYEAVLARDVDYLNVKTRVDRLRAARGTARAPVMGETIAALDSFGVGTGARYRLVRELGRGATGVVYLARDTELEREVAVKLLHPHLAAAAQAAACARFFDEARVAASLRHPNIVAILDIDEGARRIVMELAGGGTLRSVLRERGPRPLRRAIERHRQILSALAAAHRRGIVHRDLKPGNLMFRRDADDPGAEIVLADFGIAHLPNPDRPDDSGGSGQRAPARTEAVGTLAYMAPEQRRGEAEPRSDLYAAAVVLFEMLTGKHPWTRQQVIAGTRRRADFALPEELRAGWPSDLAATVQDHLFRIGSPDPTERIDTESALDEAAELRNRAVAELPTHARARGGAA